LLTASVKAIFALGKSLADFIKAAVASSIDLAEALIAAAVQAGEAVANVFATALAQGMEVLQRALHGVFKHLGPLGAALDWIMTQAVNVSNLAWKTVVDALDVAGKGVHQILDWAKAKSNQALGLVAAALSGAGKVLSQILDWVKTAGDAAISLVSGALFKAGQTINDILVWVEKDALGSLQKFVKALLDAGAAVADLLIWATSRTVQIVADVVTELLAAGSTMVQLVADTLVHPGDALKNLLAAFGTLGKTLKDMLNSIIVQPAKDAAQQGLTALKALGKSALDVLKAAAEIGESALGVVFTLILEWFPGSYRPLSPVEAAAGTNIFGKSVPLDQVRLAVMSIPVDVIEWIEQKATGQPGRAFTTMTLINFPSWEKLSTDTVVHELTHVWQNFQVGPIYMVEALEAQFSKQGYNYGWSNTANGPVNGEGAQQALINAKGNFNSFNREQEAMIIQHYWMRRFGPAATRAEYTEWQPYADIVHQGPAVASATA